MCIQNTSQQRTKHPRLQCLANKLLHACAQFQHRHRDVHGRYLAGTRCRAAGSAPMRRAAASSNAVAALLLEPAYEEQKYTDKRTATACSVSHAGSASSCSGHLVRTSHRVLGRSMRIDACICHVYTITAPSLNTSSRRYPQKAVCLKAAGTYAATSLLYMGFTS